ncbi:DUF5677 domain-containing protein, partial [Yersinia alsatica]|uniref:DUF5677 domain-containing protein n=1 Tax=Yersinia alsatica TaxID=2890317 RepID=UPI001C957D5C
MDILKEAISFSQKNITLIRFNKKSIKSVLIISIYLSMIELAKTTATLLETRSYTGLYSVYRTFLECYVDVINLHGHESYFKLLLLEFHEREERIMRGAKNGNKYTKSLVENDDFDYFYKRHRDEIKKLKRMI